ncbi:right-handed parallel beta-helix repeat-containing protein [Candidatus Eisenbacteria bacterium]|uniref:Right-handed parallel beta-helix repeat-containing protein n=1 Tax=Eiseniibacteriota bacterium TaxID=2212470 RepID=A0ABV6YKZ0_UNCEI
MSSRLLSAVLVGLAVLLTVSCSDDNGVKPRLHQPVSHLVRPDGTGDFPTIQKAINAAADGDTIELADGTFAGEGNCEISYLEKAIVVRSQSGDPQACILGCEGGRSVGIHFGSDLGPQAVLRGVTIANAARTGDGGAVYCKGSSPTLIDCCFSKNEASNGAGMYCTGGASPTLIGCSFSENMATFRGGGIYCIYSSSPTFIDCTFTGNRAGAEGGAIICLGSSTLTFTNCTFVGNRASYGGAANCVGSSLTFTNCTLVGNHAVDAAGGIYHIESPLVLDNTIIAFGTGGEAVCSFRSAAFVTCCNIFGNEGGDWTGCLENQDGIEIYGNISADPLFCDPENHDFRLRPASPCSPDSSWCGLVGAWPVGCE